MELQYTAFQCDCGFVCLNNTALTYHISENISGECREREEATDVEAEEEEQDTEVDDQVLDVVEMDVCVGADVVGRFPKRPKDDPAHLHYNNIEATNAVVPNTGEVYNTDRAEVHFMAVANKW